MATIGSGFQSPQIFGTSPYQGIGQANALSFSPAGPMGMNYGAQMMGELEAIMALMQLLAPGAAAPCGNAPGGMNPVSLNAAAGKGGKALRQAPAKGAPALRAAGGKGVALKKAAGK
ncbi:MAG: hypothetical protein KF760_23000 [Candidatus Eremiobacteraeota bacterium]|nr:hypothetical protein [Candidatus Eremiobacteraeota bacterium]MCW5868380.1 hypothetical protein [Candidatus Eremiobacteraeota bacterium]